VHPEAESEYVALDAREAVAIDNAIAKLENAGPQLPYPHGSDVRGARKLRELRPRVGEAPPGRSPDRSVQCLSSVPTGPRLSTTRKASRGRVAPRNGASTNLEE